MYISGKGILGRWEQPESRPQGRRMPGWSSDLHTSLRSTVSVAEELKKTKCCLLGDFEEIMAHPFKEILNS